MSFHWNFSSEDELEGEEFENEECDRFHSNFAASIKKQALDDNVNPTVATAHPAKANFSNNEDLDSNDSDVEWEDAVDESEEERESAKPVELSLRPVTIQMEENDEKDRPKKRRKRKRNKFRNASLAPDLSQFLVDLHKVNVLSLITGAVWKSRCCSDFEIQHLSNSLLPLKFPHRMEATLPTLTEVRDLCKWYFGFVNGLERRRRVQMQKNHVAGAPRRRGRHHRNKDVSGDKTSAVNPFSNGEDTTLDSLKSLCFYLSRVHDDNPQLVTPLKPRLDNGKTMILIAMLRSIGWRVRYTTSLSPMSQDLDVNHPLFLTGAANLLTMVQKADNDTTTNKLEIGDQNSSTNHSQDRIANIAWVEILCQITLSEGTKEMKWVSVNVDQESIDESRKMEALIFAKQKQVNTNPNRRETIVYALGVEHLMNSSDDTLSYRLTDVTPRYANSWSQSKKSRGNCHEWFAKTISDCNRSGNEIKKVTKAKGLSRMDAISILDSDKEEKMAKKSEDEVLKAEQVELMMAGRKEIMPTSKAGFKNHATYALPSQLKANEVLAPDSKNHICGMFKGEVVYHRKVVSTARTARKWLYEGRKVVDNVKPIKRVKARRKPMSNPNSFRALSTYGVGSSEQEITSDAQPQQSNVMEDLFAIWQTEPWSPHYVGPNDDIPINEFKNIELALINPGLVHVNRQNVAKVAKKLGM